MATRSAPTTAGIDDEVRAANESPGREEVEEVVDERLAELEEQLRIAGDRLRESAQALKTVAAQQMRLHPMAAFGVAFFAGMTFARLLRR